MTRLALDPNSVSSSDACVARGMGPPDRSLQLTSNRGLGFDQARFEGIGCRARPAGRREPLGHTFGSRSLGKRFEDFESQALWTQSAGGQSRAGACDLHAPRNLELVAS